MKKFLVSIHSKGVLIFSEEVLESKNAIAKNKKMAMLLVMSNCAPVIMDQNIDDKLEITCEELK